MDLQAEQERRLRRIGIEPETRKYTPHVTLARLRGAGQATIASYLATRGVLIADSFAAERFVLYSARAGSGGGPNVVEAAYPLG
jgi:RNA 2',3'-cyclic 3'-phosphodiesterase